MDMQAAPGAAKPIIAPEAAQPRAAAGANTRRLAEIEVLRAIAVLMVMLHHLQGNLVFWPTRLGDLFLKNGGFWTGVDLFFAISGFVIARALLPQLAQARGWTGFLNVSVPFWIARAWRLLPSAWLWLALPLILCLAFNRSGVYGSFTDNFSTFIAGILDLLNFHEAAAFDRFGSGTAFVQWSLSLEEQFYLALPFAAFLLRRRLPLPLLLLALVGFFVPHTPLVYMLRLWPVAMGVLLALWSRHQSYADCAPTMLARGRPARAGLLLIMLACLVSLGSDKLHIVSFALEPIALIAAILVWAASYDRGYLWQPGPARRVMEVIAARSYCLYLVHIPVYYAAHEIWFRLHGMTVPGRGAAVLYVGLALLAVFGVAELNHRLIEMPLREHGRQIAARTRARMALRAA